MNPLIIAYFIINYLLEDQANNSKQQHMQMKLVDSLVDFQKYIGEYFFACCRLNFNATPSISICLRRSYFVCICKYHTLVTYCKFRPVEE